MQIESEQLSSLIKDKYKKLDRLGEGTFGVVYKCIDTKSKDFVALKKVKLDITEDEGVPSTTIREISILKRLHHKNLVDLKDISYALNEKKLYLIFEYVDQDLKKFMDKRFNNQLDLVEIKILKGLDYCHANRIIHRDLKPQNILVSNQIVIKIADFGLARTFSMPMGKLTKDIATLWYRAPELMLGDDNYSISIDMWATGCIFAEMFLKRPLFPGECQLDMLFKIFQVYGTPNEQSYLGITKLPEYRLNFPKFKGTGIEKEVPQLTDKTGQDLLVKMMALDPNQRITARIALQHPFFDEIRANFNY